MSFPGETCDECSRCRRFCRRSKLISALLSKNTDWKIDVCHNGTAALEHVTKNLPDLIVSDLKMPDMDGFQLVNEVKDKFPVIPVIIITSQGSEELAMDALKVVLPAIARKAACHAT